MTTLETSLAGVWTDSAHLHPIAAQHSSWTDDIVDRLERVEQRLNLVDA